MVRREIKSFTLTVGDLSRECAVPCSVRSVFGAESEIIGSRAVFETNIYVDEVALAMKNFYLRVKGISSPAAVYLGDSKILDADGVTPVYMHAVLALATILNMLTNLLWAALSSIVRCLSLDKEIWISAGKTIHL